MFSIMIYFWPILNLRGFKFWAWHNIDSILTEKLRKVRLLYDLLCKFWFHQKTICCYRHQNLALISQNFTDIIQISVDFTKFSVLFTFSQLFETTSQLFQNPILLKTPWKSFKIGHFKQNFCEITEKWVQFRSIFTEFSC